MVRGILMGTALAVVVTAAATAALADSININQDLLAAVRRGSLDGVRELLDHGAAVNSRNRIGDTPLVTAAKNGNTALAMLLLQRGADANLQDLADISPLM